MSCVYCPQGYWVCDSDGTHDSSTCGPNMIRWVLVGTFPFTEGENTVWCKPGNSCEANVQDDSPGPSWKKAGTILLCEAENGDVYCQGTGGVGPCKVKVVF